MSEWERVQTDSRLDGPDEKPWQFYVARELYVLKWLLLIGVPAVLVVFGFFPLLLAMILFGAPAWQIGGLVVAVLFCGLMLWLFIRQGSRG
jgi:hypothetical protein